MKLYTFTHLRGYKM